MQIVLLAAGRGTRLGARTAELPKTLLPVGGRPLAHTILEGLISRTSQKIIVVGGFEYATLQAGLAPYARHLEFVENKQFEKGNLLTLFAARPLIKESFCLFNADHAYSPAILEKIFSSEPKALTAVCDKDRVLTDDDMKVKLKPDGSVHQMDKKLTQFEAGYVGVTQVPASNLAAYWKTADDLLGLKGDAIHVELVLNAWADQGGRVEVKDISGSVWIEVDNESDWELAQKKIRFFS